MMSLYSKYPICPKKASQKFPPAQLILPLRLRLLKENGKSQSIIAGRKPPKKLKTYAKI